MRITVVRLVHSLFVDVLLNWQQCWHAVLKPFKIEEITAQRLGLATGMDQQRWTLRFANTHCHTICRPVCQNRESKHILRKYETRSIFLRCQQQQSRFVITVIRLRSERNRSQLPANVCLSKRSICLFFAKTYSAQLTVNIQQ